MAERNPNVGHRLTAYPNDLTDKKEIRVSGARPVGVGAVANTIRHYNSMLFFTTDRYARIEANNLTARDMFYADLTASEIHSKFPNIVSVNVDKADEDIYLRAFITDCKSFLVRSEKLLPVFDALVKHFSSGSDFSSQPDYVREFNGNKNKLHGHDYSEFNRWRTWEKWRTDFLHSALGGAVFDHPRTVKFIDHLKQVINEVMTEWNGDLSDIEESKAKIARIRLLVNFDDNRPIFNSLLFPSDLTQGLQIIVNDVWACRLEIKRMTVNMTGRSYNGRVSIVLFDHFGLDDGDINKFGYFPHFRGWYILQRLKDFGGKYKPFVTRVSGAFDVFGKF